MKVQITGIESVTSVGQARIQEQFANPLDEVPYQYFSSSLEEVPIRVNLASAYLYGLRFINADDGDGRRT